jgi:hypothetical protein
LRIIIIAPKYFSVLQVGLKSDVSSAGFKALSKLPHLQQFLFGDNLDWRNWRRELRFLRLCTEYLPQLRVAGRSFDVMDADAAWYTCGTDRARGYHNELLQHLQQPTALSTQLFLNLADDFLPPATVKYPKVEELLLWEPSERLLGLLGERFASLTVLGLYCSATDVVPALQRVGQHLHTLVLDCVGHAFSLAKVLQLCPRLKRFKVHCCIENGEPEEFPEGAFSYMEEAHFEGGKLPTGFLKQVNA